MRFENAVGKTKGLEDAYRSGLQALRRRDRRRIVCRTPRKLTGSVYLDEALARAGSHGNDPRWDYAVGFRESQKDDRVIWLEVHPASSHHIQEMFDKLAWLKRWLASSARSLQQMPAEYVWVSSGKVAIPASSRQRREVAARGIRLAGERLCL